MTDEELKAWAEAHAPYGCSVAKAVLDLMGYVEDLKTVCEWEGVGAERDSLYVTDARKDRLAREKRVPTQAPDAEWDAMIGKAAGRAIAKAAEKIAQRRADRGLAPLDDMAQGATEPPPLLGDHKWKLD